jgi:hypothetical protein
VERAGGVEAYSIGRFSRAPLMRHVTDNRGHAYVTKS